MATLSEGAGTSSRTSIAAFGSFAKRRSSPGSAGLIVALAMVVRDAAISNAIARGSCQICVCLRIVVISMARLLLELMIRERLRLQVDFRSSVGMMDIGEVAERSGVPPSTLRYYEE